VKKNCKKIYHYLFIITTSYSVFQQSDMFLISGNRYMLT